MTFTFSTLQCFALPIAAPRSPCTSFSLAGCTGKTEPHACRMQRPQQRPFQGPFYTDRFHFTY
jgi:hypothetical protein